MKKLLVLLCFLLCSCGITQYTQTINDETAAPDASSTGGTATLSSNAGENGYLGAYDFSSGKAAKIGFLDWNDVGTYDMYFYDTGFYPFFNGNEYVISTYQQDMGQLELGAVTCPAEVQGYTYMKHMKEGNVYCIKTRDGRFAKIKVTAMTQNHEDYSATVSFDWEWAS